MHKLSFAVLTFFLFFAGCYSSRYGGNVHSKPDKDIMASGEILITSLFFATQHVPEEEIEGIEFFEHGKSSLSKEAKAKIAVFAEEVLSYEDYSVTVEGHADPSEISDDDDYKKLSTKRAEAVRKALIRNGIDKDKIEYMGVGISKPASKAGTEEGRQLNRRVIIEAELW